MSIRKSDPFSINQIVALAALTSCLIAFSLAAPQEAVANSGRLDHDAQFISLGSEWKRDCIAKSPGQPLQYGLGDRIWYRKKDVGALHFFTLLKPGQSVTAVYHDILSHGRHTLTVKELTELSPLYDLTSERHPSLTSGRIATIGGRQVAVLDGEWSFHLCSRAYAGLKPGEKVYTSFRARTVLLMDNSALRFEGIECAFPSELFDEKIVDFEKMLSQLRWK